jgi:RimJ/RimL family protein N-acetyltransferase
MNPPIPNQVVLETPRLRMRPWAEADIPELLPLIGAKEVAATTLRIPHPYTHDDAVAFLRHCREVNEEGLGPRLAIVRREDARLCGGIGLVTDSQHQHAELGYWIGVPYWGQGYATEAARAMVDYGFKQLKLHRIFASHFPHNPASARVLQKIGMKHEGSLREHIYKWDKFYDMVIYGILR